MGSWCCSIVTSYYSIRGGACTYGDYCGTFYIGANLVASAYVFGVGAVLSLLHIILFVVVILELIPLVEFSVLAVVLLPVVPVGSLVLFNHLTSYYTRRGGTSNNSEYCGIFFFFCSNIAGHTYWGNGAALPFI